jgi:TolB-like protein
MGMADVFVSYCRRDKARVARLVAAIQAEGWSVWWDPDITPGQEFDRQIDAELELASAALVVWTPASVESRWVRGEAREAADRGILVPVRFDDAILPIDVRALHTIDLDDSMAGRADPRLQEMLHAIGALVARRRASMPVSPSTGPALPVPAGGPARVAICVLPFANMSGDPEQQYFSDGITEDIITELSRWRLLAVRSRTASFRFRGVAVDMQQVARELGVDFIVEGSVRRMGSRVRITAQLIDAATGSHVWADKFDRDTTDLFAMQDQVVRTIVGTLVGRVQVSDVERALRKPPTSLAAYECVLKGNAESWDTPGGAAEARRLFEQAIAIDPGYGMAHALLAAMRYGQWYGDYSGSDALLDESYALAKRAVELDSNESTCFSILAQVCVLRRAHDMAMQHARRAIAINPNNQWNMADMGLVLIYAGHAEEALDWFRRAREVDPYFDPPWYFRGIGQALMTLQRYDEALAMFDHLPVGHYRFAALRCACQARLGNTQLAREQAAICVAMKPDFTISRFVGKEPYRDPADAARLAGSLRMAGLPE